MSNARKTKKSNSVIKFTIIGIVMAGLIVGYYYYLNQKERQAAAASPKLTKVEEVLSRNLETNYPPTPKEVIKYYSELTKCFYNEEYSQGQMEELADKARQLYDDQLVENNQWGTYIINLQSEIEDYKKSEKQISSYSVASSTDVDEFSQDGFKFARLHCIYTIRQGGRPVNIDEVFLLRKDDEGHWKIFGWELAEKDE